MLIGGQKRVIKTGMIKDSSQTSLNIQNEEVKSVPVTHIKQSPFKQEYQQQRCESPNSAVKVQTVGNGQ